MPAYLRLLTMCHEQKQILAGQETGFRPETRSLLFQKITSLQEILLREAQYLVGMSGTGASEAPETSRTGEVQTGIPEESLKAFYVSKDGDTAPPELPEIPEEILLQETGTDPGNFSLSGMSEPEAVQTEIPMTEPASGITEPPDVLPVAAEVSGQTAVKQTGENQWSIPDGVVICQTQEVTVTRDGEAVPIRFSIAPLQTVRDGLVPVIVNAEYQSFTINQATTFMSEEGESLLQMDVDRFTFLIKGSFHDGVFHATVMSTGRSVEAGDVVEVKKVRSNTGTVAAQEIRLCDNATLRIAFDEEHFFGILHSGEWTDEFNESHDVMVETDGDYSELKVSHDGGWILGY